MTDPSHFTDPKWAAQIRTDQEAKALTWLDEFARCGGKFGGGHREHARTLKDMVMRTGWPDRMQPGPVMPEEPSNDALHIIRHCRVGLTFQDARVIYGSLYRHLIRPKTKTVEVWMVWFSMPWAAPSTGYYADREGCDSLADAKARAQDLTRRGAQFVSVTGPHRQEVPT